MVTDLGTLQLDISSLNEGDVQHFTFLRDGREVPAFVVRYKGECFTYVNRCPHVTYSLDFADGNVQDASRNFLQCHSHGALFLPESGECFMGPAVGRSLESLPSKRDGDTLLVYLQPEPEGWPHPS